MKISNGKISVSSSEKKSNYLYNQIDKALDLHQQQLQFDEKVFAELQDQQFSIWKSDPETEYRIWVSDLAWETIRKLDQKSQKSLSELFKELARNPFHLDSHEAGSQNKMRLDFMNCKIYYEVKESNNRVQILKISRNSEKS